jgi:peptidoglycan/LPS O-acetylase OafA/YrhL
MKFYLFFIISGYFLISNCYIYAQKKGEFSYMIMMEGTSTITII